MFSIRVRWVALCFTLFCFFVTLAHAAPADFSVSPDNSQRLLLDTIGRARKSLHINIYMVTSKTLERAITERVDAGVAVTMLVEAQPYGGKIVSVEKEVLERLKAAFDKQGKSRLLLMTDKHNTVKRRFVFNHAKYVLVDETMAYVSSENFVGSGVMSFPDNKGNRGWQILINQPKLAKEILAIFTEDTNTKYGDVADYDPSLVDVLPPLQNTAPYDPQDNRRTLPPLAAGRGEITRADLCLAPQALHCQLRFIKSAKKSLDVQQLSLPLYWPRGQSKAVNPLVDALLASARRGVRVRLMLSASTPEENPALLANPPPPYDSQETIRYIEAIAQREHLDFKAVEINLLALQLKLLHNKGFIADERAVFLGSLNGTENSVNANRELSVALLSPAAARYFGGVFTYDWQRSQR